MGARTSPGSAVTSGPVSVVPDVGFRGLFVELLDFDHGHPAKTQATDGQQPDCSCEQGANNGSDTVAEDDESRDDHIHALHGGCEHLQSKAGFAS